MDISIELKVRLRYVAIYEVGANKLLYHNTMALIFDSYYAMKKYLNLIIEDVLRKEAIVQKKETVKTFDTILYEEYPIEFIWGPDGSRIYLPPKTTEQDNKGK